MLLTLQQQASSVVSYHSSFNDEKKYETVCGLAVLPVRTKSNGTLPNVNCVGPALKADFEGDDIVDEAINFFRANILFKSYEVRGPADKVLIYLTVFI